MNDEKKRSDAEEARSSFLGRFSRRSFLSQLGAAGVAYADSSDAVHDFSADNGANHNLDTGHFLGVLSL